MRPGYINSSRWWRRGRGEGRAQYPSTGPRGAITFAWLTTSVSVRPYPRCLVSLVVIVVRHPDKTYRGGKNFGPRLRELAPRPEAEPRNLGQTFLANSVCVMMTTVTDSELALKMNTGPCSESSKIGWAFGCISRVYTCGNTACTVQSWAKKFA